MLPEAINVISPHRCIASVMESLFASMQDGNDVPQVDCALKFQSCVCKTLKRMTKSPFVYYTQIHKFKATVEFLAAFYHSNLYLQCHYE